MQPAEPIRLTVTDLGCERDDRVLFQGLSFSASRGEIWQITGANGTGKTTLLRILAGLHGFYEGQVTWTPPLAADLLYLGHQPGVREELNARENLQYSCALSGQDTGRAQRTLIDQALAAVDLYGFEDVPASRLSAGQKRRIALARLWLCNESGPSDKPGLGDKRVWLLDEPYTAIDQDGIRRLEARLRQAAAAGTLVIYTSHHQVADGVRRLHLQSQGAEVLA